MTELTPDPVPESSPLPRSVEALLQESRRLRMEADRLERQAADLREAIRKSASPGAQSS